MRHIEKSCISIESALCPIAGNNQEGPSGFGIVRKTIGLFLQPTAQSGWSALVNQGVVSASNFLTGVIIGRACSKEEFGLYIIGYSIVFIVLDLQASLISIPYMVYSPHLKGRKHRLYAGSSLIHELSLSTAVITALAACGAAFSFGFGPPGLARVIWALAAAIGFIMLREFIRRLCFADLRMEIAFLFDFCVAAIQVGGLIVLYYFGLLSANRAFWVIGLACGIACVGWLLLNRKAFTPRTIQTIEDFKHNWKFGKWVFASAAIWTISMNLYPSFLTFFQGTASAGVWAACMGVLGLINVPLAGIQNFLGPKISNIYAKEGGSALRRFVFRVSLLLLGVMTILCCALFFIADPLLSLFYGAKYTGNGMVVIILAFGTALASVAFSFSRALFAIERADIDFKVNFLSLFVFFVFGIWLVKAFGPFGAALGLLLAHVATSGVRCASFVVLSRPMADRVP